MMIKKGLLVFLIGLMSVVLIACGGDKGSGDAEETMLIGDDVEDATELTYWTFVELHMDFLKTQYHVGMKRILTSRSN